MSKVPKGKVVYRGAHKYVEGQECPFYKEGEPKKEEKGKEKKSKKDK